MTPRAKAALDLAVQEAQKMGDEFVGTEHLLFGILLEGEGPGSAILKDVGVTEERLRDALARVRATGTDYEASASGEPEPVGRHPPLLETRQQRHEEPPWM